MFTTSARSLSRLYAEHLTPTVWRYQLRCVCYLQSMRIPFSGLKLKHLVKDLTQELAHFIAFQFDVFQNLTKTRPGGAIRNNKHSNSTRYIRETSQPSESKIELLDSIVSVALHQQQLLQKLETRSSDQLRSQLSLVMVHYLSVQQTLRIPRLLRLIGKLSPQELMALNELIIAIDHVEQKSLPIE